MSIQPARRLNMNYFFIGLTALILSACGNADETRGTSADRDQGTSFNEAKNQGRATLSVIYVPAPGFAYKDEDEQLTGVTVEIMRDFKNWFERYHGVAVELDFIADEDWSNMFQRVSAAEGGVFGLGNVTITEERREELRFSPPYLYNVAVLITPDDVEEITSQDEFAERVQHLDPLAFSGTLHEVRIRRLRDAHQPQRDVARVNSNQAIIDGVVNGHYSYVDAYNYYRAKEQGTGIKHHNAFNLDGEQFGIIMPHSNDWDTLLTAFFAAESGYLNTQRYADHLRNHLGEGVADMLLDAITE